MNIHQISVAYKLDADRILVQIKADGGEALRLWLTRRLVINLLPNLDKAAGMVVASAVQLATPNDDARKMLLDIKKTESIASADFKTPFNAVADVFPVGQEPLLVTTIQLTPLKSGSLRVRFEEKIADQAVPRSFEVAMASQLLHGFTHLLEAAIRASGWGILGAAAIAAGGAEADKPVAASPPRYLN